MSNIGPVALENSSAGQPVFLGGGLPKGPEFGEGVADRIDDQVREIIKYCEDQAVGIMQDNRVALDLLVDILIDRETIDGEEFRTILSQYTDLPIKRNTYISQL